MASNRSEKNDGFVNRNKTMSSTDDLDTALLNEDILELEEIKEKRIVEVDKNKQCNKENSKEEKANRDYENIYLLMALIDLEFSPSVYETLGNTVYLKKICEKLSEDQKRSLYELC